MFLFLHAAELEGRLTTASPSRFYDCQRPGQILFWRLDQFEPQLIVQRHGGEASQFTLNKDTYEKLKARHDIHAVEAEWHSGEKQPID